MERLTGSFLARAKVDGDGVLQSAQEPLAELQYRCGGTLPGAIAIPELREAVRQCLQQSAKISRTITAFDGDDYITAQAEIAPDIAAKDGCLIGIASWSAVPYAAHAEKDEQARRLNIDRSVAEVTGRLDATQSLLTIDSDAPDCSEVLALIRQGIGRPWTDFVTFPGEAVQQPLHWRLLDGSQCKLQGSDRTWTVHLEPHGENPVGCNGFDLYLIPDTVLAPPAFERAVDKHPAPSIGKELAPVLRQPISRIIANAETIRTKMAGPLAEEYSTYAADIANAGKHLLSLLEDLSDLEVIESEEFATALDCIELGDIAHRAAGILAVRAREKNIVLDTPDMGKEVYATAEFRRVLQILLNLVGNAIRYSPAGSTVKITIRRKKKKTRLIVTDEGPGLSEEDQFKIFEKFERLGRSGNGGSGLGLYISRTIARAMGGELSVESALGKGAQFILDLPAAKSD